MSSDCEENKTEEDDDDVVWRKRDSYRLKTFKKEIKNNQVASISSHELQAPLAANTLSSSSASVDIIQLEDDRYRVEEVAPAPPCGRKEKKKRKQATLATLVAQTCRREKALVARREMVVEWQIIATVIDRLLFWMFLIITIAAYLIILVCEPYSKPLRQENGLPIRILSNNSF